MNKIDPKAVWQRVQKPAEPAQDLLPLLQQVQEDLAFCNRVSRWLPENLREPFRQLYRQEQHQLNCLGGICRLLTAQTPSPPPIPPREPAEVVLRRYYGRLLRRFRQYEGLLSDPQFGPVFAHLARQTREEMALLLELLGLLP